MAAEGVARLTRRNDEHRTVGIGEIINPAIARAMDVRKRVRTIARRAPALQRVIPARCTLVDVHEPFQERHLAKDLVLVFRRVGIAPAQAFQRPAIGLVDPDQRLVQRDTRHIGATFHRCGLHDVTPRRRPVDVAEHPLKEQGFDMRKFIGQWPQIVADQAILQMTHPRGIDQGFWHVLIHLAVPVGQQAERGLTTPFGGAVRRGLTREPQIAPDQRQQGLRAERHGVQLRLDKAFARVHLTPLHQTTPAVDALRVAPVIADVERKGPVDGLVVGVADDATARVHEARV